MATVAVLGMGRLGLGFAEQLLAHGHTVRVWNRTLAKCDPAVALGATAAPTPAQVVHGVDRVHLVLTDDSVVDPVIEALIPGLAAGVPLLDHSTNLPAKVGPRFAALRAEGIRYLHAPVFMGPAAARAVTGAMLICGPSHEVTALTPALQAMTGKLINLGEDPTRAATVKLQGNGILMLLIAGMGDLFKLGQANGMNLEESLALFDFFRPTPDGMGRRMIDTLGKPASFTLTMARKDVGLMLDSAAGLEVLPAIAAAMDTAIADGRGDEDFTTFVLPK